MTTSEDELYLKALYASRQFAKRQITWMRSWEDLELFDLNQEKKLIKFIKNLKEIKSFV
jgi:tRNA dimethylallyltransferase